MIDENCILSAGMFDRGAFESLAPHLAEGDMSAVGELIWQEIRGYYATDPQATRADPKTVAQRIERGNPKAAVTAREILYQLAPELGGKNPAREVLEMKRRSAGEALMVAVSQQSAPLVVSPLLARYTELNDATTLLDAGAGALMEVDLAELITRTEEEGARIKLLPKSLNNYMRGGVLPGHCVVVFGRVNAGKSTFALHNAAGFLRQGKRVLYIENEDLLEDTLLRLGCRLVGKDRDWARANAEEFKTLAMARGFGNFLLPDPAPMELSSIDQLIAKLKPDVCIVNQARNLVQGSRDPVSQLDNVAKGLRNIGKRRRVVMLLVTAAREGDTTNSGDIKDKAVLEMHDCYSSRTGFPAAADVMIGFGVDKSLKERDMACLSLCKNKLGKYNGKTEAVIYVKTDFDRGLLADVEKNR